MRKYLWILAAAGVLLLGSGVLVWNAKTAPPATTPAVKAPPMPVQVKTKTRNVYTYDSVSKVGELTFTLQKYTSATENWVKLVASSLVFEITNQDYMTAQTPMPQTELIPVSNTARDDWEPFNETAGIDIEGLETIQSKWFVVNGGLSENPQWTWENFFDDPCNVDRVFMNVGYWNPNIAVDHGKQPLALSVEEETP